VRRWFYAKASQDGRDWSGLRSPKPTKNELDDRLAIFEKQRQKYEEQVNILEEQLPRFIPDFGKKIQPRSDKKKSKRPSPETKALRG